MTLETACGKIILFGEHAVVYGRPALAVPLAQLRARAFIQARAAPGIIIHARDVGRTIELHDAPADDALALIARLTLDRLGAHADLEIVVESDIPLASGFGSGAAISTAIVRALAAYFGKALPPAEISALVYETERMYHGTPSGIDNTVIAYEQAIRFVRRKPLGDEEITPFHIARPFTLAIAHTGIASPTKITVGDVRRAWENDPARFEKIFDAIGALVEHAQAALAHGENEELGELMTRNQRALETLGVSSREIETLLDAGLRAGAGGGKLSGGGRGGNVIFYVELENVENIKRALLDAGAASVSVTQVGAVRL
ncbi:MAG: mevalonate kinase [Chloroflexi bacterium]|nr:mevalonate kinase [Chloroflexota bacterium]